jgi:hypothetical protein
MAHLIARGRVAVFLFYGNIRNDALVVIPDQLLSRNPNSHLQSCLSAVPAWF